MIAETVGSAAPETFALVDGLSLAISAPDGHMPRGAFGLLVRDTRHLSVMDLRVEGKPTAHLLTRILAAGRARFHGYAPLAGLGPDAPLEIERHRAVNADGLVETIVARLWGAHAARVELSVRFACDFADIFVVRGLRVGASAVHAQDALAASQDGRLIFHDPLSGLSTEVAFDPPPTALDGGVARWALELSPAASTQVTATVEARGDAGAAPAGPPPRARVDVAPAVSVRSDPPGIARACQRAVADRESLLIPDRLDPSRRLTAGGIPWFVALFGRDSLIAGHQARAFDPGSLRDTLQALAARQGTREDPSNDERPGKILHEVRLTPHAWLGSGTAAGQRPYYGSIDATPLFIIMCGEAWRWGMGLPDVVALLPAAWAALEWMRAEERDGLLSYAPGGRASLANQAWKDSQNAVQHPDGSLAAGPLAMVEVQGYAVRARIELAGMLRALGDDKTADALSGEAAALRARIRDRFWLAGTGGVPGFFAMALDGEGRPVASPASNMGHLLWCDVPSPEQAGQVAEHLRGPGLASGWGVRTLSSRMAGFNPISYHAGSVWPHDTAIACAGLRRYGLDSAAAELAEDLIDAAEAFGGRLPELFGGHSRRGGGDAPIPYPHACRPQAWAAGAPLALVTTLLGLEPDIPAGRVTIDPVLPSGIGALEVEGIPLAKGRLSVDVDRRGPRVVEAPPGLVVELRGSLEDAAD